MNQVENILIKPVITEKSTLMGEKQNRYCFRVNLKANKHQIKRAIEDLFDVKVIDVHTTISAGKKVRAGKSAKKRPSIKKAYAKIKDGQKIEFFKGI